MKNPRVNTEQGGIAFFFILLLVASLATSGWLYLQYLENQLSKKQWQETRENLNLNLQKTTDKIVQLEQTIDRQKAIIAGSDEQIDLLNARLHHQMSEQEMSKEELNRIKRNAEKRAEEIRNRELENESLRKALSNTDIRISNLKSRFTVFEMPQEILFNKGDATLKTEGQQALKSLAAIFDRYPDRQIAIQGHSDNQNLGPETRSIYPSNWELSAARAASAIHYLQDEQSIDPERMILVSYSKYRPISSNDTLQGRSRNRRIEIILMPRDFDFFRETTGDL